MESETVIIKGQCPAKSNSYGTRVVSKWSSKKNRKVNMPIIYKKAELVAWEKNFSSQLLQFRNPVIVGRFQFTIIVYFRTWASDIDNALKGTLDCLEDNHWIHNDRDCVEINIKKKVSKDNPRIVFKIKTA